VDAPSIADLLAFPLAKFSRRVLIAHGFGQNLGNSSQKNYIHICITQITHTREKSDFIWPRDLVKIASPVH
jgi:hypothetical protein